MSRLRNILTGFGTLSMMALSEAQILDLSKYLLKGNQEMFSNLMNYKNVNQTLIDFGNVLAVCCLDAFAIGVPLLSAYVSYRCFSDAINPQQTR